MIWRKEFYSTTSQLSGTLSRREALVDSSAARFCAPACTLPCRFKPNLVTSPTKNSSGTCWAVYQLPFEQMTGNPSRFMPIFISLKVIQFTRFKLPWTFFRYDQHWSVCGSKWSAIVIGFKFAQEIGGCFFELPRLFVCVPCWCQKDPLRWKKRADDHLVARMPQWHHEPVWIFLLAVDRANEIRIDRFACTLQNVLVEKFHNPFLEFIILNFHFYNFQNHN